MRCDRVYSYFAPFHPEENPRPQKQKSGPRESAEQSTQTNKQGENFFPRFAWFCGDEEAFATESTSHPKDCFFALPKGKGGSTGTVESPFREVSITYYSKLRLIARQLIDSAFIKATFGSQFRLFLK